MEVEGPRDGHSCPCVCNKSILIQSVKTTCHHSCRSVRGQGLTKVFISKHLNYDSVHSTINVARDGSHLRREVTQARFVGR